MVASGITALAWAMLVWQWQDPVTALYTRWQQHKLAQSLDRRFLEVVPPSPSTPLEIARTAKAYRRATQRGDAIGRIIIQRMGLDEVLVNGTDEKTLRSGPGRYLGSFMPGEGRLVYVAGHRTTFLAPFAKIDELRTGDRVTLRLPYATFVYSITGHRVVAADDVSVLRSGNHEQLALQACHPRFFATHRYIAYATLVGVAPRRLSARGDSS